MSNSSYPNSMRNKQSRNPFEDDDFKFGNRGVVASGSSSSSSTGAAGYRSTATRYDEEDTLEQIQERIGRVENDSLESTRRALRTLNETEEVGVKTAEELVRQGEKLQAVEDQLDNVNNTLNATQKNLNQIKSVFGGLKNKFFGVKTPKLDSFTVSSSDSKPSMHTSKSANTISHQKADFAVITGSDREKEMNKNLEEMSMGLKRLANLGLDMQRELDRQDPLINRLNDKAGSTKYRIDDQQTQIKKILKQ